MSLEQRLQRRLLVSESQHSSLLELHNRIDAAAEDERILRIVGITAIAVGILSLGASGLSLYLGSWKGTVGSGMGLLVSGFNFFANRGEKERVSRGISPKRVNEAEQRLLSLLLQESQNPGSILYMLSSIPELPIECIPPRQRYQFLDGPSSIIFRVYFLFFSIRSHKAYLKTRNTPSTALAKLENQAAVYKRFAANFFMLSCMPSACRGPVTELYKGQTLLDVESGNLKDIRNLRSFLPKLALSSSEVLESSLFQIALLLRPAPPPALPPKIQHVSRGVQTQDVKRVIRRPRILGAAIVENYGKAAK